MVSYRVLVGETVIAHGSLLPVESDLRLASGRRIWPVGGDVEEEAKKRRRNAVRWDSGSG
jgi:hypothetical protein